MTLGRRHKVAQPPGQQRGPVRALIVYCSPSIGLYHLVDAIANILGVNPSQIDLHRPFDDHSLNSQQALQLVIELESKLGRQLPRTIQRDHPTIASIGRYLSELPGNRAQSRHVAVPSPARIAIVGTGCLAPTVTLRVSGEGGIRTLGTLAGTPVFETGTFGHSVTSPDADASGES